LIQADFRVDIKRCVRMHLLHWFLLRLAHADAQGCSYRHIVPQQRERSLSITSPQQQQAVSFARINDQ